MNGSGVVAHFPSSPRVWGWTSSRVDVLNDELETSPRAWGWTVEHVVSQDARRGRPHARGGGPKEDPLMTPDMTASPRAWGWTAGADVDTAERDGVPTRVGVDRSAGRRGTPGWWRPHARGGGPVATSTRRLWFSASPRAWGWTVDEGRDHRVPHGVPTRVGVDRMSTRNARMLRRRPHARGGGPALVALVLSQRAASPRAWGWTVAAHPLAGEAEPARAPHGQPPSGSRRPLRRDAWRRSSRPSSAPSSAYASSRRTRSGRSCTPSRVATPAGDTAAHGRPCARRDGP